MKINPAMLCTLIAMLMLPVIPVRPVQADEDAGYRLAPVAVRHAAARIAPSLVTIDTVGGVSLGQRTPQQRQAVGGLSNPGEGPTTGMIISSDGYIITSSFNFIRKPRIITVSLSDGTQYVAELLGQDETRKLTLLKINDVEDLPAISFVPTEQLRVGQWAISVGVGYGGEEPAVSLGIISAMNRAGGRAIQTDANISPANYGGPLVDIAGNVIGICTPLNPKAQGAGAGSEWYDSGIGFAVSLHELDHIVDRMKKGDTLQQGLIGIMPSPRPAEQGVQIANVMGGSPAAAAGLQQGDIITAVNDKPMTNPTEMRLELSRYLAGDTVKITRIRDGEEGTLEITLATGPFEQPRRPGRPGSRNTPTPVPTPDAPATPATPATPDTPEPDATP